ncbi:hypothetical protein [Streptomyces sp. NPDC001401]|uniref:hypothetical protein n=1 Tax=Streptomyces sp. NPDC001401 TaxID=3364570 RepID=UPI0036C8E058
MRSTSCGSPMAGSREASRSGSSVLSPARSRHSGAHTEGGASDRAMSACSALPGGRFASRRA